MAIDPPERKVSCMSRDHLGERLEGIQKPVAPNVGLYSAPGRRAAKTSSVTMGRVVLFLVPETFVAIIPKFAGKLSVPQARLGKRNLKFPKPWKNLCVFSYVQKTVAATSPLRPSTSLVQGGAATLRPSGGGRRVTPPLPGLLDGVAAVGSPRAADSRLRLPIQ